MRLIQYGPPDSLCTLTQCFGHAAQNLNISAIIILLAPKDYFWDMHQEQAERANRVASNRKYKANALLNVTNYGLRESSRGFPNSINQSWLEDVIKGMLNLHQAEPNHQPRPDAWPSSNLNIPKDLESGQGQSETEQDGPRLNTTTPVRKVGVDTACHPILVDIDMGDGTFGDGGDGNSSERLTWN